MGCCCSTGGCCGPEAELERCGTAYWSTKSQGRTEETRRNANQATCDKIANFYQVPVCIDHFESLQRSIQREGGLNDSTSYRNPAEQLCAPAAGCKVPDCEGCFYSRVSMCREHFSHLAHNSAMNAQRDRNARQSIAQSGAASSGRDATQNLINLQDSGNRMHSLVEDDTITAPPPYEEQPGHATSARRNTSRAKSDYQRGLVM